jgi:hypothetical protein
MRAVWPMEPMVMPNSGKRGQFSPAGTVEEVLLPMDSRNESAVPVGTARVLVCVPRTEVLG